MWTCLDWKTAVCRGLTLLILAILTATSPVTSNWVSLTYKSFKIMPKAVIYLETFDNNKNPSTTTTTKSSQNRVSQCSVPNSLVKREYTI